MLTRSALVLFVAFALLLPSHAGAGGWWTWPRVSRDTVAVGQRVEVSAYAFASTADAIEAEQRETFYVYLLRGFDYSVVERAMRGPEPRNWWSLGDAEALRVGRVRFGPTGSNLANVSASFTVPSLPVGTYAVMLCDAGCTRPLANVIPATGFTIVTDPVTARVAAQADRLELQARRQAARLDRTRAEASAAGASASIDRAELRSLSQRLDATDRRVAAAERSVWEHVPWLVAGAALGVLLVIAVRSPWGLSRPSPHTAVRVARPSSSSRGGRSPFRPRRSGGRSSLRA